MTELESVPVIPDKENKQTMRRYNWEALSICRLEHFASSLVMMHAFNTLQLLTTVVMDAFI